MGFLKPITCRNAMAGPCFITEGKKGIIYFIDHAASSGSKGVKKALKWTANSELSYNIVLIRRVKS